MRKKLWKLGTTHWKNYLFNNRIRAGVLIKYRRKEGENTPSQQEPAIASKTS